MPRKFPLIRPLFYQPQSGEKYRLEHLQPLARQLYERACELTDIPVYQLLPWRITPSKETLESGAITSYELRGVRPVFGTYFARIHAVHPSTVHKLMRMPGISALASVLIGLLVASRGFRTTETQFLHIEALSAVLGLPAIEARIFRAGVKEAYESEWIKSRKVFQREINNFYRDYGPDGLLALMAKAHSPDSPEELREVRDFFEHERLLTEKGFTPAGEKWFKQKAARNQILERLKRIREVRRKAGLPV